MHLNGGILWQDSSFCFSLSFSCEGVVPNEKGQATIRALKTMLYVSTLPLLRAFSHVLA
jgi:hypothetical protein